MPAMHCLESLLGPERASRPFIALVSPSIRSLLGSRSYSLVGFLKSEGARAVFPVDSGVPEFARECALEIASRAHGGIHILSACPAARPFILREFPELSPRILSVPSPMAIRARAALKESGLTESGFALAVTPCIHKKSEQRTAKPEMIVVQLMAALAAAKACGVDPLSCPPRQYDEALPAEGLSCRIAQAVADELTAMGVKSRSVRLDGEAAARAFLLDPENGDALNAESGILVAEVDFCEGGCAVPEGVLGN